MLKFSSMVAVVVCAPTRQQRRRFVALFERMLGYTTQTIRVGTYVREDNGKTDREAGIKVEVWGPDLITLKRFIRLARWMQIANEQESVAIEYVVNGRWAARVVFSGDWAELEAELVAAFSQPEPVA